MAECWWLVSATLQGTYVTPQFAVLAVTEKQALDAVAVWVQQLNFCLPLSRQLAVGAAERLT